MNGSVPAGSVVSHCTLVGGSIVRLASRCFNLSSSLRRRSRCLRASAICCRSRRLPFQGAGQVPTRFEEPVGNQHRVRQRGDQVSAFVAPRSCSTRLCPIDLGDRLVIQLPQNLEAPIGSGRVCPIRSQQRLHDPWEQIRVNARVAVELKLKRAIVQTVQSVGSDRRFSLWRVWRHVSWAVSRERRTRIRVPRTGWSEAGGRFKIRAGWLGALPIGLLHDSGVRDSTKKPATIHDTTADGKLLPETAQGLRPRVFSGLPNRVPCTAPRGRAPPSTRRHRTLRQSSRSNVRL